MIKQIWRTLKDKSVETYNTVKNSEQVHYAKVIVDNVKDDAKGMYDKVRNSDEVVLAKKFIGDMKALYQETVDEYRDIIDKREEEKENARKAEKYPYDYIDQKWIDNLSEDEYNSLKKKVERFTHKLNIVEMARYEKFLEDHRKSCDCKDFDVIISQCSGIGQNVSVRCNSCNKEVDITDYKSW